MERDVRGWAEFSEAEALYRQFRGVGSGCIHDAAEVHVSPCGERAVFTASINDQLEAVCHSRIALVELASGVTRMLTAGPNNDRGARFSPDGKRVAFLSDATRPGDYQLCFIDMSDGTVSRSPTVPGWIEYLRWSPDGRQILLSVAGHGADMASTQGAIPSASEDQELPAWMPSVDAGDDPNKWRVPWVCDAASGEARAVQLDRLNAWEMSWCGAHIVAIVSDGNSEGDWYEPRLVLIDAEKSEVREIFRPSRQLGWPAATPRGDIVAFVEAIASDRWSVAGELKLLDPESGVARVLDTNGIDVTYLEWRSDNRLLIGGHRGVETVVAIYDRPTGSFKEIWGSTEISTSPKYVSLSGFGVEGQCLFVSEGFLQSPAIASVSAAGCKAIVSFDLGYEQFARGLIGEVRHVNWQAPDGLEITGILLLPRAAPRPCPLLMHIHGGPVSQWRTRSLGRNGIPYLMLMRRGNALFYPNPRGSTGRGQHFAERVVGDMGGADTYDYLSGIDYLVEQAVADPGRLYVTGGSYGGYMTSWLVTQDKRFAAAVSVAPVTNKVSQHLMSNIPQFVEKFLDDQFDNIGGRYLQRSPIMFARSAITPMLNICGAEDRCTPPAEAQQFHNALRQFGVETALVTYPGEGHGIKKFPAVLDYAARIVRWICDHPVRQGGHYDDRRVPG